MLTGLRHAHMGLGYLLVLSCSISVLLALANAFADSHGLVRAGTVLGRRVEPALMGIIALIGLVLWFAMGLPVGTAYLWIGVAALFLQGMVVGMATKPALVALADGDSSARFKWVGAAVANALVILFAFGAMQAKL